MAVVAVSPSIASASGASLASGIGNSLLTGQNQPGLSSPLFTGYTGAGSSVVGTPSPGAITPTVATGPTQAQIDAANAASVAAQSEATRVANVRRDAQVGETNDIAAGQTDLTDAENTYNTNSMNDEDTSRSSQQTINNNLVNNALTLRRSMSSIADNVRNGVNSAGTELANDNASDSGAADDFSKAYAMIGNRESQQANNDSDTAITQANQDQANLNLTEAENEGQLQTFKKTETDRVSNNVFAQLSTIDSNAQDQGVTGSVDYTQRDNIINDALARLSQIDTQRAATMAGITQLTPEQVQAQAVAEDAAGAAGVNPYATGGTTGTPTTVTATPSTTQTPISAIPLFTKSKTTS